MIGAATAERRPAGNRPRAYERYRGMDAHIHAYYEDIEALYRADTYELGCRPSAYRGRADGSSGER
jgi:hypothetical protein